MCSVAADLPMEWSRSGDGDEELLMGEASCGGDEPVEWVQVAVVAGRARAHIISGRLSSAGLPVSLTQEAAGISLFPTDFVSMAMVFGSPENLLLAMMGNEVDAYLHGARWSPGE